MPWDWGETEARWPGMSADERLDAVADPVNEDMSDAGYETSQYELTDIPQDQVPEDERPLGGYFDEDGIHIDEQQLMQLDMAGALELVCHENTHSMFLQEGRDFDMQRRIHHRVYAFARQWSQRLLSSGRPALRSLGYSRDQDGGGS